MRDFKTGEVILIDKEPHWSSFDVVNKVRKEICLFLGVKKLKVGHAGTLDPLATGLVILCTGKKTKEIEKYQAKEKEYIAEIFFGKTTASFDLETEPTGEYDTKHIDITFLENVLKKFTGKQKQIPPIFSAKKINGERAYIKAREGDKNFNLKAREIEIIELEILDFKLPVLKLRVLCSKGTYIRSLANDIGRVAKSGAFLASLRRTKIGEFSVDNAVSVKEFTESIKKRQ